MANQRDYTCSVEGCGRPGYAKGLCNAHYQRQRLHGDPLAGRTVVRSTDIKVRLRQRTEDGPGGCWLWTGALDSGGYGQVTINRRNLRAHRVSYEAHVGPIPEGMQLDHLCRVRRCIRPDHLEPVTPQQNTERGWLTRGLPERCGRGHLWSENAVPIKRGDGYVRQCRSCDTERQRTRRARSPE